MKKTYSTIILILGIGLGGFLFAQQSKEPGNTDHQSDKSRPAIKIQVQKDLDEDGNIIRVDSSYSWTWSGDERFQEDIQVKLQDFFENFNNNFSFHFDDSTLFRKGFHEFFNEDFKQNLDNLQGWNKRFDDQFIERLNENLEKLQDQDIQLHWNDNFNQQLEQGLQRMLDKWQKFYQNHQENRNQRQGKPL